jgi:hypothetical protein
MSNKKHTIMKNSNEHWASRKLGINRGTARLWLEGQILSASGWNRGDHYTVIWGDNALQYVKDPEGKRKVAGTESRPIIDTNSKKLTPLFGETGSVVTVTVTDSQITIRRAS